MQQTAKIIIIVGVIIVILGIVLYFMGDKLPFLGRLPGDIRIEKENFRFYFPITTMIIVSIVISLILKILKHFF